ncbi:MAG: ABC transporter permease subunit [Anaerolineales bacterium]|jgi:ABC-type Na+ efflux pump permease subunit
MNLRAIRAIVEKDLKVVSRQKGVLLPMIIVPLIFLVIIPIGVSLAAQYAPLDAFEELSTFIDNMPATMFSGYKDLPMDELIIILALVYFMAPMFLIIPLMVASVIAADSFAGEKERKSLEALIYTPTTDSELLIGKLASAWIPAWAVSFFGFIVYALVVNIANWSVMGRIFFPNLMWILLAFWVAPAAAGLGLSSMVIVSARVKGFQEAYQLGGSMVLPIVLLVIGQAAGVIYFNTLMVVLLGAVFWSVNALLLWIGARSFHRSEMIAQL